VGRDHLAGVWRTLAHYGAGELLAAKTTLLRTDKLQALDSHVITAAHENARARVAFGYGYFEDALKHNQAAIDIIEGAGPYVNLPELVVLHTYMSISADQRKLAQKALKRIRSEPGLVDFLRFGGAIALLDAWRTLRYGDIDQCIDTLRGALKLAHDSRDRQRMRSFPKALEELLPIALARDIETDVTRRLITDCGIAPPPTAPESWPWPIKIYTLGRFEILIDGKPAAYGRKSPKRTLALLKALIALGETNVPEQRLADLLWPDLEGDAAHESLAAALHRLRRLLGDKDALFQSGGALSINQQRCFVDARAFEAYGNDSSAMLELYRGDFLSGDGDVPWAASMRERLRGKFIRAIESLGRESELEEAYDEAIAMYLRGIDADDLVEPFYRGLMRCYAKLDRRAEAAGVFRRLRQRLSVTLGSSPAPETQRLFDEIGLERESSN
jgi:DNA-binding SARP family transcriptional activator